MPGDKEELFDPSGSGLPGLPARLGRLLSFARLKASDAAVVNPLVWKLAQITLHLTAGHEMSSKIFLGLLNYLYVIISSLLLALRAF